MPRYRITNGTFRDSDDSIKGPGDEIELGEDVARANAHKVERLHDAAPDRHDASHVDPAADSPHAEG